jgi:AcrR family transcriptional regulator
MADPSPALGLRERKKTKTKDLIQTNAMRMFRRYGYDETTVEDIAEAVEVSPSTFFRYFATKQAVVFDDEYDSAFADAIKRQPARLSPFEAVRRGVREIQESNSKTSRVFRERNTLIMSVPELRAAWLERSFSNSMVRVAEAIAERSGRERDEFEIKMLAGAIHGVLVSSMFMWAENPSVSFDELLNRGVTLLEAGFPLKRPGKSLS